MVQFPPLIPRAGEVHSAIGAAIHPDNPKDLDAPSGHGLKLMDHRPQNRSTVGPEVWVVVLFSCHSPTVKPEVAELRARQLDKPYALAKIGIQNFLIHPGDQRQGENLGVGIEQTMTEDENAP